MKYRYVITSLMACMLCSCSSLFSRVVVTNLSGEDINNLEIRYEDRVVAAGILKNGERYTFYNLVTGEGDSSISYRTPRGNFTHDACYYSVSAPPRGEITIHPNSVQRVCE